MRLEGKKVLILGGAYQHIKLVKSAQSMGVTTYVTDYLDCESSPAKIIADRALMYDIMDTDALIRFCKDEQIDGVIGCYLDRAQLPYATICASLGYACFASPEQFHAFTNKRLFTSLLKAQGLKVIPEYAEDDFNHPETISGDIFPLIVKPSDSRGSRGQTICETVSDVRHAIPYAKCESQNKQVIIQKYMGRRNDFEAEYLIVNGHPYLVSTGDRMTGSEGSGIETLNTVSVVPSLRETEFLNSAHKKISSFLANQRLANSPVFLQGVFTGEDLFLYDPGLRFMGDDRHNLWARHSIDIPGMMIKFAITGSISDEIINENQFLLTQKGILVYPAIRKGVIKRICGLDEVRMHPDICSFYLKYKELDVVEQYNDLRQRFGEFVIRGKSYHQILATIKWLFETLLVYDSNGNNMLCEQYNAMSII